MKKYQEYIENKEEKRTIETPQGELEIKYKHLPNVVGRRSPYNGLPIWVGKTEATGVLNGGTAIETESKCWLKEPYTYSRGRVVTTGRILKELNLPTSLAEKVKE